MSDFLRQTLDDGVLLVTMDRPGSHNALSDQTQFDAFTALHRQVEADQDIRVVVLTGAGKSFCAGGNVKDMARREGLFSGAPYELAEGYRRGIQQIPLALSNLAVPTIAAINGPAIGAGCDLACMCDIRVASERARFAESFVKLGIVPGDGGAWLLPRAIGQSRACEMAFTGEPIDAQEALRMGLVSRVVAHDELLAAALDLASRIAANPGPALRLGKRLMRLGQRLDLADLLEVSASFQALAHNTEEHAERMSRLA